MNLKIVWFGIHFFFAIVYVYVSLISPNLIFVVITTYNQRCDYKISLQNLLSTFSLLAAIHIFISSHDEITDFCSMDKKTGRRYLRSLQYHTIYNQKRTDLMTCTHKPGQNNRVYYTACNLYSTGDRPCNFVFILLLLYQ